MDNSLNQSIIEKVITKNVAIHIALNTMCPPSFEDKFKNESLCQKNTQTQNSEKSLNVVEPNNVNVANDTMNNIKTNSEEKSWRDITDPKLRRKMSMKETNKRYREKNKDKRKEYQKEWERNNKNKRQVKRKIWSQSNKNKINNSNKKYYDANKEKLKIKKKVYREANKDKIKFRGKIYRESNKDKIRKYCKYRYKNDIQYKLNMILRGRLRDALKNNQKVGSAVKDLGCSIDELKTYLESKFQPGMTWDNWTTAVS